AEAAHGLDEGRSELAAQTGDEDLDGVGVAIEILRVDVLRQFILRDDAAAVVHEIREHAEFVAGQFDGKTVARDAGGAGIEDNAAAAKLRAGLSAGAADQRA